MLVTQVACIVRLAYIFYVVAVAHTQKTLPVRNNLPVFATKTTNKTRKGERKRGSWCGWMDSIAIATKNVYITAMRCPAIRH